MKAQKCPLCGGGVWVREDDDCVMVFCNDDYCELTNGAEISVWNRIRIAPDNKKLARYDLTGGQFQCDEEAKFTEFAEWMNPKFEKEIQND